MKNERTPKHRFDRLTLAAILLVGATVICLLAMALVAGLTLLRPDATAAALCRQIVRQYGLHMPALMPAGESARRPEGRLPGVDLRYDPRLPPENPDAGLVFPYQPPRFSPSHDHGQKGAFGKGAKKMSKDSIP